MRSPSIAKLGTVIGAAALALCLAAGSALAAARGGAGGHPGGFGGGHFGGFGGGHFGGFGGGRPAFIGGGRPSFGARGGVGRFARPSFRGVPSYGRMTRYGRTFVHTRRGTFIVRHAGRVGVTHVTAARVHGVTAPRNFAAHRRFAGVHAYRRFLAGRWHWHRHLGWIGPWFWPYAYGDWFYCGLWPWDYCYYDPFWAYGYFDIYEGMFWPYDYSVYVQGPEAPARMAALTQTVAQSCTDEAAEVTGWPIDQIQAAVKPDTQQTALLDDLGNAIVKASDVVKAHCPTRVSFTPTDRLADMQTRLEGMVQAADLVQPPLAKFYDSLSDEQKARFNAIGAPGGKPPAQGQQPSPQAQCGENVIAFPTDRINQIVQPNDAQRGKLDALVAASAKAADLIKASCPSELPATPPDRFAAESQHLQAMLSAVQTIRPALEDFYNALSDEQKARFNTLGRQLFAAK